jgi:exonuclease SbcC
LEEIIKDKEKIDVSDLEKSREEKNLELSNIELSLKEIHSKVNNNKIVYDKLTSVYDNIKKLEEELLMCEDLSNTANGNIKGKSKLEFEQYVQASYFDNVLESANKRFSYMTDSRYLLARKVEATRISDKLGLELEVIDNYTGKRREITSLSGGESFKASLALALGMSDIIQSYSGGIVVETMFIDEGFGSLDSESLETAMNAIMMLSNNNRLIGIISHVNELKDRIDKNIVVTKSSNGSSVSVVV